MVCREGPSLWHKQRGRTDHHLLFKYTSPKTQQVQSGSFPLPPLRFVTLVTFVHAKDILYMALKEACLH